MTINPKNIGELREAIKDLPDDMYVFSSCSESNVYKALWGIRKLSPKQMEGGRLDINLHKFIHEGNGAVILDVTD